MKRLEKLELAVEELQEQVSTLIKKNSIPQPTQPEPNFKIGDWFIPHKPKDTTSDKYVSIYWSERMNHYDKTPLQVRKINNDGYLGIDKAGFVFHPSWCEEWIPRRGEYVVYETNECSKWAIIFHRQDAKIWVKAVVNIDNPNDCDAFIQPLCLLNEVFNFRPATPSEIALLDQKLLEQGKKFDKDKCEIVEVEKVPKKQLVIGEPAIFWNNCKGRAIIRNFAVLNTGGIFITSAGYGYLNAIPFESIEQYKEFIKG